MGVWVYGRIGVWACLVVLTVWLMSCPSPSATDAPALVTMDATQTAGTLSRTLYGFSLQHIPDESELQALNVQGITLVAVPLSASEDERAWSEQHQKLTTLLQAAEAWGMTVVLRAPQHPVFVRRLLEKAQSDGLRTVEVDAALGSQVLKEGQRPVSSASSSSPTLLLRNPSTELISSLISDASVRPHPSSLIRCGFSISVNSPDDERLAKITVALKQVDADMLPPLFVFYQLPVKGVSAQAGLLQMLQQCADVGIASGFCETSDSAASTLNALRSFRLLSEWAQLYGNRVRVSSAPPAVALATRREDGVSLSVANGSSDAISAQLRLRLPPGAYCVEVRKTDESGLPGAVVEKPPLWVTSSTRLASLSLDLPPQSLAALRLTNLPFSADRHITDLIRQISASDTLQSREKSRALFALRSARRPLQEVLAAQKFTPDAVSRAAHRSLLQIGQAEAVFRNEVEKGRVREEIASLLNGQFAEVTHLLSAASAAGLGLRFAVDAQGELGTCPLVLKGQEPAQLSVRLTHQGLRPVERVEVSVQTDDALTIEPFNRRTFTQLRPNGQLNCEFRVRRSPFAPGSSSPLRAATPLLAQVTVSYYADRSNARLSRTVEFYDEGL